MQKEEMYMANSYKKQSRGLISNAFGVAKKLTNTGFDLLTHVAPGSVAKLNQTPEDHVIIEGQSKDTAIADPTKVENPQQIIRQHVPKVTQQLLGRHYNKVNNVASFISPDLNNKIADYFFDKLDDFSSSVSSVDHVLKEVGAQNLDELASDAARSTRVSHALGNQNKMIAAIQGAVTGATGVLGSAIDIPSSLVLTLRAIYQTGRAHGFELDRNHQQEVVEYVFKQVDLGSLAEKQTMLVALRTLANVLETQNVQQLQGLLGSTNDFSVLQKWLNQDDGSLKWSWLNHIPKISVLAKLKPLAGAGIGAFYSIKLIEEANQKAEAVFASAQQYRLQHPSEDFNILEAYEKSKALIADASPVLLKASEQAEDSQPELELDKVIDQVDNEAIKEIRIEQKPDEKPEAESVSEGLKKLAETHIEAKPEKETASAQVQPAAQKATSSKGKTSTTAAKPKVTVRKKTVDAQQAKGEVTASQTNTKKAVSKSTTATKSQASKGEDKTSSSLTKNGDTTKLD